MKLEGQGFYSRCGGFVCHYVSGEQSLQKAQLDRPNKGVVSRESGSAEKPE